MQENVLLFDQPNGRWLAFSDPVRVLLAHRSEEVLSTLRAVEKAVNEEGLHAAGFLAYEAAAAFDPACTVLPAGDFPLLWFGLYRAPRSVPPPAPPSEAPFPAWRAALDEGTFSGGIAAIKEAIARGETYQVNFTFPLRASFDGDPRSWFSALVHGQNAGFSAFFDTGRYVLCSASPELFFALEGERLTTRPMKGTAPRGRSAEEDRRQREALAASVKDRAENLMILDMVRNDLGRLGGKVDVPELFTVERYPTVWQMTSTAETRTDAPLTEIFTALFPCASITGAPKYQTMRLIAELEGRPRGIYTGAIGTIAPGRRARFSVAIRTALIDRKAGTVEYGVGAGITWDSDSDAEYRECLQKARILEQRMPEFSLLESLRWEPEEGYRLLEEHLTRLSGSAEYFAFPWDRPLATAKLAELAATLPARPHKVRLLLAPDGALHAEAAPIEPNPEQPLRLALAAEPVDADDPFLYHKTTHRVLYEKARRSVGACDEVLLWNARGEVTEASTANLVVELDGARITPPVACGLLPGTLRAQLLADGEIVEQVVKREDLRRADRLYLVNSVRGRRAAVLAES